MIGKLETISTTLVFIIILAASSALAAIPQKINYQGSLTDSGGAPVNTGVEMVFSIYNPFSS